MENQNDLVKRALKLENCSPGQIVKFKISHAIKKYQKHPTDTASSGVQFAVMTEKIIFLTQRLSQHKRDKQLLRSLQILLDKRRKMMYYLQRTDFHTYKWVSTDYDIPHQMPQYAHHKTFFGGFINKVQWKKAKGRRQFSGRR